MVFLTPRINGFESIRALAPGPRLFAPIQPPQSPKILELSNHGRIPSAFPACRHVRGAFHKEAIYCSLGFFECGAKSRPVARLNADSNDNGFLELLLKLPATLACHRLLAREVHTLATTGRMGSQFCNVSDLGDRIQGILFIPEARKTDRIRSASDSNRNEMKPGAMEARSGWDWASILAGIIVGYKG